MLHLLTINDENALDLDTDVIPSSVNLLSNIMDDAKSHRILSLEVLIQLQLNIKYRLIIATIT